MTDTMLIAQITDFHIVEHSKLMDERVDTAAMLTAAITRLNHLVPRPDVVLATGDLVNNGTEAQYAHLAELLVDLELPLLAIPGNHDDRTLLRATIETVPAGGPLERVDYVSERWPVRLIGLDTSVPGQNAGLVSAEQMRWLDETLAIEPDKPTLLFQHHPPFATGVGWMDELGLAGRELEETVLEAHPQVLAVVCGHVHRPVQTLVGGTVASTCPSTGAQIALALDDSRYGYCDEPSAIALHQWTSENGIVSHISYVEAPEPWLPDWAQQKLSR